MSAYTLAPCRHGADEQCLVDPSLIDRHTVALAEPDDLSRLQAELLRQLGGREVVRHPVLLDV